MPLTIELIASCFKVGDEFYSESRGSRYLVSAIEQHCVRINPERGATVRLNIEPLSILYDNILTIDLTKISERVNELLYTHGINETSRETQLFAFAKACYGRNSLRESDRRRNLANTPLPEEVGCQETGIVPF